MIAVWLRLISLIFQWEEQDTTCYQMPMPSHWTRYPPPPPKLACPSPDFNIPIIAIVDTNCVNFCWKRMKSNLLRNVNSCEPCCYISLICPLQLPKVHMAKNSRRYSYTLEQNCGDNCLHFPSLILWTLFLTHRWYKEGGLWYQVGKAPRSRHRLLRRRKIWGMQSLVNLYSLG